MGSGANIGEAEKQMMRDVRGEGQLSFSTEVEDTTHGLNAVSHRPGISHVGVTDEKNYRPNPELPQLMRDAMPDAVAQRRLTAGRPAPMVESGPMKWDADKPRVDLMPTDALIATGQVFQYGAHKYAAWNWLQNGGFDYSRLYAAALRHLFAFFSGEENDSESGLPHLAHAICCCMMLYSTRAREIGNDDRPTYVQ